MGGPLSPSTQAGLRVDKGHWLHTSSGLDEFMSHPPRPQPPAPAWTWKWGEEAGSKKGKEGGARGESQGVFCFHPVFWSKYVEEGSEGSEGEKL